MSRGFAFLLAAGIMQRLKLIPKATNREPALLIVEAPVQVAIVVGQVAVPGGRRIDNCSAPPMAGVANIVECTIVATVAARKT